MTQTEMYQTENFSSSLHQNRTNIWPLIPPQTDAYNIEFDSSYQRAKLHPIHTLYANEQSHPVNFTPQQNNRTTSHHSEIQASAQQQPHYGFTDSTRTNTFYSNFDSSLSGSQSSKIKGVKRQ